MDPTIINTYFNDNPSFLKGPGLSVAQKSEMWCFQNEVALVDGVVSAVHTVSS